MDKLILEREPGNPVLVQPEGSGQVQSGWALVKVVAIQFIVTHESFNWYNNNQSRTINHAHHQCWGKPGPS